LHPVLDAQVLPVAEGPLDGRVVQKISATVSKNLSRLNCLQAGSGKVALVYGQTFPPARCGHGDYDRFGRTTAKQGRLIVGRVRKLAKSSLGQLAGFLSVEGLDLVSIRVVYSAQGRRYCGQTLTDFEEGGFLVIHEAYAGLQVAGDCLQHIIPRSIARVVDWGGIRVGRTSHHPLEVWLVGVHPDYPSSSDYLGEAGCSTSISGIGLWRGL
jgi:hypothetical protein